MPVRTFSKEGIKRNIEFRVKRVGMSNVAVTMVSAGRREGSKG
jgi:hypothetical protein